MGRVRAAYEEAHVQDTTEERVVYDRRGPNEATSRGGWPSTGASCALSRVTKGGKIQVLDQYKGY
jgi:hypothetical protein